MEMRNLGSIYVQLQLYANMSRLRLSVRIFKWKYWGIKIKLTEWVGYTISYNAKITSHQLSRNIQKTLQIANLYDILLSVKKWSINYSSAVIKHWYLVQWCIVKHIIYMEFSHFNKIYIYIRSDYISRLWLYAQFNSTSLTLTWNLEFFEYHSTTNIKSTPCNLTFYSYKVNFCKNKYLIFVWNNKLMILCTVNI